MHTYDTLQNHFAHMVEKSNGEWVNANEVGAIKKAVYEHIINNKAQFNEPDEIGWDYITQYVYSMSDKLNSGETTITELFEQKVHKITADNIYADYDGTKWVCGNEEGKRYYNAINASKRYFIDFIKQ